MSAGHHHSRPNARHPQELKKLQAEPSFQQMLGRRFRVDSSKDIPDLAGYSVAGTVIYLDQDFAAALQGGQIIVKGMTPHQIADAVITHERHEKADLDADNPTRTYQNAHEMATVAEHEFVRSCGATPRDYERALAPIIKVCSEKPIVNPPMDLDCEPYVDRPDKNDKKVLKAFRRLGVIDATKAPKESVEYSPSTGADRCDGCEHYQAEKQELAACDLVAGAVRDSWWCNRWEQKEQDDGQELDQGRGQAAGPTAQGPRGASGGEDTGKQTGGSGALQEPEGAPAGELRQDNEGAEVT